MGGGPGVLAMSFVPPHVNPELGRIEHLFDAGQFHNALQAVETLELLEPHSPTDQLTLPGHHVQLIVFDWTTTSTHQMS